MLLTVLQGRIGYQDAAGAMARRRAPDEHFRLPLTASPFGTIHAAIFSFPQPVGTAIPSGASLHLAAYDPGGEVTGALPRPQILSPDPDTPSGWHRDFPEIDRTLKGPRLVPRVQPQFEPPQPSAATEPDEPAGRANARDDAAAARPDPDDPDADLDPSEHDGPSAMDKESAPVRAARLYFDANPPAGTVAPAGPWPAGATPAFMPKGEIEVAALPPAASAEPPRNETIAPKGEVTGEGQRPKSPAELLGLTGAARAKHEKCLADAIYFEARGEQVRGQMAVAQVVVNRVFSGYYPNNVCGVVYQNSRRHLACQFTFTCDGIPDRINEPAAWERAKHIARDALDGKFWLNDIGKATHYHAYWVHPWWVREMRKLDRIGVHTFYRPRNWGDGASSPVWGDAETTAAAAKDL